MSAKTRQYKKEIQGRMQKYSTKTYCFRLYQKHLERFQITEKLYSAVTEFYVHVLLEDKSRLEGNNLAVLRRLEVLTLGEKKKQLPPTILFPYSSQHIPLYFRRAAINEAIAIVRSKQSRNGGTPTSIQTHPVFYQGMYRNFSDNQVELKLYDGKRWNWSTYRFTKCGREIPQGAKLLSPTLILKNKQVYMHIPVQEELSDTRTLLQRISQGDNFMTAAFPMGEVIAAGICFSAEGTELGTRFIRRGDKFIRERRQAEQVLQRMLSMQSGQKDGKDTKRITAQREEIRKLMDLYVHQASNELIQFAKEHQCSVLVVPSYNGTLPTNVEGSQKPSRFDWLGKKVIDCLEYKAPAEGMLLYKMFAKNISNCCNVCGSPIRRYGDKTVKPQFYGGRKLYVCEQGHKGNAAMNTARNMGHKFRAECKAKGQLLEADAEYDIE